MRSETTRAEIETSEVRPPQDVETVKDTHEGRMIALAPPEWSSWMSASDFQAVFNNKFANGFYPPRLEGMQTPDGRRYRATFVKRPAHAELTQRGYRIIWSQTFLDADGNKRFQVTWIKE